ncbi:hypothetical protein Tco_0977093 [Tanacetum coccineum]|uniref:Uncharacterized protein n=1 Tax=Tanacetum coccineum TaxID=301880 RepID=A0ABQ5EJ41_9ASTR
MVVNPDPNAPLGVVVQRTNAPLWVVANQTHPYRGDSGGDGGVRLMVAMVGDGGEGGVGGVVQRRRAAGGGVDGDDGWR